MASTYAAMGEAAPSGAEFGAFADAMSGSYGAPLELFSVDPVTGAQTVLADTSTTNLLAELPVLETEANGVNLGLQLADGAQIGFSSTARLADFLYAVSVQQMQATSFVTDNYNLDMQWLDTVDQPLLNEAVSWSEQAANETAVGGAYYTSLADENNAQAGLALKIAAEAPGSRQDMSVTINNPYTGNPTQVTVYAGGGNSVNDYAPSIVNYIESAIGVVVNILAVVYQQPEFYWAAAAIDSAEAGQDFVNGEDLQGILSVAQALSAGITAGAGGTVGNTPPPVSAQVINIVSQAVGGVYGIVQSAENGNGAGILAGALEAAAAAAAGIGSYEGGNTQKTLNLVSTALGVASVATDVGSDFASGNLGQGLVDSLNLYLPALALAQQAWVTGSGATTKGAAVSSVPAQNVSQAVTEDGGLPIIALAVADDEIINGAMANGTKLSPQDVANLQSQLVLAMSTSSEAALSFEGTIAAPDSTTSGSASGAGNNIGNTMTITLPPMQLNTGVVQPSIVESIPSAGTIIVTPGPGSQDIIQGTTITTSPTTPGAYDVNTSGGATPAPSTAGDPQSPAPPEGTADISGNLYLPVLQFLANTLANSLVTPAEAAQPSAAGSVAIAIPAGYTYIPSTVTRTNGTSVTITFVNDNPTLPTPNQPVYARLGVALAQIIQDDPSIISLNVNGTLGRGFRTGTDVHTLGLAVDINSINGQNVTSLRGSSLLAAFQTAIQGNPSVSYFADPNEAEAQIRGVGGQGTGSWVASGGVASHQNHVHIQVFPP